MSRVVLYQRCVQALGVSMLQNAVNAHGANKAFCITMSATMRNGFSRGSGFTKMLSLLTASWIGKCMFGLCYFYLCFVTLQSAIIVRACR